MEDVVRQAFVGAAAFHTANRRALVVLCERVGNALRELPPASGVAESRCVSKWRDAHRRVGLLDAPRLVVPRTIEDSHVDAVNAEKPTTRLRRTTRPVEYGASWITAQVTLHKSEKGSG